MCELIDIDQIVEMLEIAFPNFKPRDKDQTKELYWQTLNDIPSDELKAAVLHCLTEAGRAFAPSVGEIRGAVNEIKRLVKHVPSALEAWGELLHAPKTEEYKDIVEENGQTFIQVTPYKWSHPLVRKVAVMMGFPKFPDWESESYERTAFFKAYEIELQSYLKQDDLLPIVTNYIENSKVENPVKLLSERLSK